MQKKLYLLAFIATFLSFIPESQAQRGRSEFAVGYGYFSFYQFANRPPYNVSSGTISVNYRYYLSSNVTLGLSFGYERISNWASFATFAPEVTVKYLDTRNTNVRVRLYGGISYGLSALTDLHVGKGYADESGAKPWGLQVTPFGMRVGRTFAGFVEIGAGYKGIFHGGMALRFPRKLHHHNREAQ